MLKQHEPKENTWVCSWVGPADCAKGEKMGKKKNGEVALGFYFNLARPPPALQSLRALFNLFPPLIFY